MIVLKIIGWTLLILLILLVVLLHFSAVITVHAARDGFDVKMKYLGFTLYPRKKKGKPAADNETEETGAADSADELKDKPKPRKEKKYEEFADDLTEDVTDEELMHGLDEKKEQALLESAKTENTSAEAKKEEKSEKTGNKSDEKKSDRKDSKNKESKKKGNTKDADDGGEDEKPKKSLRERISDLRRRYEKIKPYIPVTWKYFKKLLKAVRIRIDDVWVKVGRDDAHEAAIFYGTVQAAICSLLTTFAGMFTLKVKRCDVECRFAENVIDGGADISVRVRPSTVIAIVVCVGVKYLVIWLGGKIRAKREKKARDKSSDNNTAVQTA